jgi:phosphomannomutase
MTDAVCETYAAAFVRYLRSEGAPIGGMLIGRDLRPSSPRIAAACVRSVQSLGVGAIDCGVVPTPALALEAARRDVAAIMVTGSPVRP